MLRQAGPSFSKSLLSPVLTLEGDRPLSLGSISQLTHMLILLFIHLVNITKSLLNCDEQVSARVPREWLFHREAERGRIVW